MVAEKHTVDFIAVIVAHEGPSVPVHIRQRPAVLDGAGQKEVDGVERQVHGLSAEDAHV